MIQSRQKFDFHGNVLIEKVVIEPPFRYQALFEDEGCFLYMSGTRQTFNSPNEKILIQSEESVLLKCGSYFVDWLKGAEQSACTIYVVHLYAKVLGQIYRNEVPKFIKHRPTSGYIRKISASDTITKFVESLDFYFENPEVVSDELLELKIKELVLLLTQTNNAESIAELMQSLFTPRKAKIKEVVNLHMYANLSVDKLAEMCSMSASTFKREFQSIYGVPPIKYMNNMRLERAHELITCTDKPISLIAFELGFNDPAYFSRVFKSKFGVSPQALR